MGVSRERVRQLEKVKERIGGGSPVANGVSDTSSAFRQALVVDAPALIGHLGIDVERRVRDA